MIPYDQWTDGRNAYYPQFLRFEQHEELEVIGHDYARSRILLRRRQRSPWEHLSITQNDVITVRSLGTIADTTYVEWSPGHVCEMKDCSQYGFGTAFSAQVSNIDHQARNLVLKRVESSSEIALGKAVTATVKCKIKGGFIVDLGGFDGFLPEHQAEIGQSADDHDCIGRTMQCVVVKIDEQRGSIIVSRRKMMKIECAERTAQLVAELQIGQRCKGIVKRFADFGAFVDVRGADALLHITDMSWTPLSHPSEMLAIGQEIEVQILRIDFDKKRINLGLKQMTRDPWDDVGNKYPVGKPVRGTVKNVVSYGAFVELEKGIDGLLHKSEISRTRRISDLSELVQVDDELEVVVLKVDTEKHEISLGIKQSQENSWDGLTDRYPPGVLVTGTVTNLTDFGAFIEIEEGIEGLLHASNMSWTRKISRPDEMVETGEVLECCVLSVDQERHRVRLGLIQLPPPPWPNWIPQNYMPGKSIIGTVAAVKNDHVLVDMGGIRGILYGRDISWDEAVGPAERFRTGESHQFKVIGLPDQEGRLPLGLKQVEGWLIKENSQAAEAGSGRVLDLLPQQHNTDTELSLDTAVTIPRSELEPLSDLHPCPREDFAGARPITTASAASELEIPAPSNEPSHHTVLETAGSQFLQWPNAALSSEGSGNLPDLDMDFGAWQQGLVLGTDLAERLDEDGYFLTACFVRFMEGLSDTVRHPSQLPAWCCLGKLAAAANVVGTGSLVCTIPRLEGTLRAAATNPGEAVIFEELAEILKPELLDAKGARLEQWLQCSGRHVHPLGVTVLRIKSLESRRQYDEAFFVANSTLTRLSDSGLVRIRNRLVDLFQAELKERGLFFSRFERVYSHPLQSGGYACVIPVRDRETGELHALKHFWLQKVTEDEMSVVLDMFANEGGFLKRLHHPSIVAFHDMPGRGCILLEWLPGRSLDKDHDHIGGAGDWWDVSKVLSLSYQIASALKYVGDVLGPGFVHNDLVPWNIMIDAKSYPKPRWVKLIDFGVSCDRRYESLSSMFDDLRFRLGLPYRAPEVSRGERASPQSDIFALGTMMFKLITGTLPDPLIPTDRQSIGQLCLRGVPEPVARMVMQMLDRDPVRRPDDWASVVRQLDRFVHTCNENELSHG